MYRANSQSLTSLATETVTAGSASAQVLDKQAVASAFSRAAQTYDGVTAVQRWAQQRILAQLDLSGIKRVLDLGCGTGQLLRKLQPNTTAQLLGLDIAEGMLQAARQQSSFVENQPQAWLCADAEQLPLMTDSLDLVVSNFAMQWFPDLGTAFQEIYRILSQRGRCYFSLPVTGTLQELRDSWQQVDPGHSHVNDFHQPEQLKLLLSAAGFSQFQVKRFEFIEYHRNLASITGSLKAMGAQNITQGRSRRLTGKSRWSGLQKAYENYRQERGLPVSWQVGFGVAEKI